MDGVIDLQLRVRPDTEDDVRKMLAGDFNAYDNLRDEIEFRTLELLERAGMMPEPGDEPELEVVL